ncbi:MAG: tetratricopeptide repeat protein, partial [Verrucomicrobiaceae bacterium]|nr:tetratricopeptide repeat protein [Verrucomicrobiaceae bacterium]
TLTARRHAHSELATLVVTQMQLSSVLGADGHGLHEAHLTLTHSGEQFVRLNLPAGAELLSTLANRQAVKPVRTTGDAIAIPLPAGSANEPATTVTVQFRLGTTPWTANGEIALTPVTLAKEVPVLSTTWNVHTPERFAFDKVQTTLEQSWFVETPGIMPRTFSMLGGVVNDMAQSVLVYPPTVTSKPQIDFLPGGLPETPGQTVSGLANREIVRRYTRIDDAKHAIERGDDFFRAGDYEGSLGSYNAAVASIPDTPNTKEWRDYARLKYADCAVVVAKERAKVGKYEEAREILILALADFPDHKNARVLLENLNDPDRWPPALTQQQLEEGQKVQRGLLLATTAVELGNYDDGIRQYQDVLRVDPYSSAARRGMEEAEKKRAEYFKQAYDHQRAKMLAEVDEKWEEKKPTTATPLATNGPTNRSAGAYLTAKMDRIIFPTVQFQNATVEEAVEYLRVKSRDLDTIEADPSRKGINIVLRSGDAPTGASVSLDLKNVPFSEALRYVTDLSQMKYKVESNAVVIVPITDNNSEMFTRSFRVAGNAVQGGDVRGFLAQQGIAMPDGSSATYQSETRSLVVRNTQPNLDLVESLVSGLNSGMPLPPPAAAAPADPFAAAPQRGSRLHASIDEMLFDPGKSGLIPLDIVIPATGRLLRFQGHQAPETLVLRYRSWEHQILWASLAMLAGMLLFARCVWRRPWIATLFVIVVAAWGFPLVLEGQLLAYAHAAVFGWLAALALRVLMSVMAFGNRLRAKLAATTVNGEEVAA